MRCVQALRMLLAAMAVVWACSGAAAAQPFDGLPPVVVATSPAAGQNEVQAGPGEIRVTFSRPMTTENAWSWVMRDKASFPRLTGQPSFLPDGRTCVLPVELDPGTTYVIWINSQRHTGFRDLAGKPARPYLLYFRTRP